MSSIVTKLIMTCAASSLMLATSGCSTVNKVIPGGNSGKATTTTAGTKVYTKTAAPRMGVNEYLWRATLETINFMPLLEVDPFGGVIITDWYTSRKAPNERFKGNVYILDSNLRADALKVSVFKQVRSGDTWVDADVDLDTARTIENSILTRARELYIASVDQ